MGGMLEDLRRTIATGQSEHWTCERESRELKAA